MTTLRRLGATVAPGVSLAGVFVLLAAALIRTQAGYDPFPGWSADPTLSPTVIIGLTPSLLTVLDGISILAALLVLIAETLRGNALRWWAWVLLAAGCAVAIYHANGYGRLSNSLIGTNWCAAMLGAAALSCACRAERTRRLAFAALIGVCAPLLLKGLAQVFVEHPDTVAAYKASRESFLASQGWTPGSVMARTYERRLYQPEATGWFGLANTYATVMAAACVAGVGLLIAALRDRDRAGVVGILGGAGLATTGLAGVLLAGAKGGYAAVGVGLLVLVVAHLLRPRHAETSTPPRQRWRTLLPHAIGPAIIAGVLSAVAARGVVGERLGELSLLFRWFYMQASVRIFGDSPVVGVGPGGFKDAYVRFKNPLSPEEVSSPHSLMLDWAATLGIGGVCWAALWLVFVSKAGRGVFVPEPPPSDPLFEDPSPSHDAPLDVRFETRILLMLAAIASLTGAYLESQANTPLSVGVRGLGIFIATVLGIGVLMASGRGQGNTGQSAWGATALGAAALAAAAHAQVEMTGTAPSSAAWLLLLVGVAAGGACPMTAPAVARTATRRDVARRWATWIGLGLASVAAAVLVVAQGQRVWKWERPLRDAHSVVTPAASLWARWMQLKAGPDNSTERANIERDFARLTGVSIRGGLEQSLAWYRARSIEAAIPLLERAQIAEQGDFETARALSRLWLSGIDTAPTRADGERMLTESLKAMQVIIGPPEAMNSRATPAGLAWVATIHESRAALFDDTAALVRAAEAWRLASEASPYEVMFAVRQAQAYAKAGRPDLAAQPAKRALDLDLNNRLDPLRGLGEAERNEMERLSRGGAAGPG